ncbi:MAG: zinc-ribbon domain-containing protein [Promethearchaeota archaeon]
MFCMKCGEKILDENQKFCQKCGAITKTTATASESSSQLTVMSTQPSSQKPPIPRDIGIHSKRSLAFGITSLGLNLAGGIMMMIDLYGSRYFSTLPAFPVEVQAFFIVAALVFGILARSNGNKAEAFESSNGMQKAGKIMGLLGIIFSAVEIGNTVLFQLFAFDYIFL